MQNYESLCNIGAKNVHHGRIKGNEMTLMEVTGTIIFLNSLGAASLLKCKNRILKTVVLG